MINYRFDCDEEQGIMQLEILGTLSTREVGEVLSRIKKTVDDKSGCSLLIDMTQVTSDPITKQARSAFKQCRNRQNGKVKCGKIAVVGNDAVSLMIAKIALTIAGQEAVTRYFKERQHASAWLMERG